MSTPETARDHIERVESMATDSGDAWDLSLNEQAALHTVLRQRADLLAVLKEYVEWGAMTGSDRDLFDSKFREAIAKAEGHGA